MLVGCGRSCSPYFFDSRGCAPDAPPTTCTRSLDELPTFCNAPGLECTFAMDDGTVVRCICQ